MELSFNDLKKRDVINVPDGRCLGRVTDIRLNFPNGVLVGIVVPGRRARGIFRWFDKTEVYIERSRIIKIGGDVILVDISTNKCKEPCPPPPPKPCKPPKPTREKHDYEEQFDFDIFPKDNSRIDTGDY